METPHTALDRTLERPGYAVTLINDGVDQRRVMWLNAFIPVIRVLRPTPLLTAYDQSVPCRSTVDIVDFHVTSERDAFGFPIFRP